MRLCGSGEGGAYGCDRSSSTHASVVEPQNGIGVEALLRSVRRHLLLCIILLLLPLLVRLPVLVAHFFFPALNLQETANQSHR